MTDLPAEKSPKIWITLLTALLAPFLIDSCSSTHKIEGLPDKLPDISLSGSNATPPNNLPGYEYPFDPSGHYVSTWAADGERRAGRSPIATDDDERRWSSSHHGHVTATSKHTKKGAKSGKKKSSSDDEDKPKSKSKKSSSKKGSGGKSSKKKSSSHDEADKPKSKGHSSKKKKKSDN